MEPLAEFDYVVVDSAFHEGLASRLQRDGVEYYSLFEQTPERALEEIAPLLIPLARCSSIWQRRLLVLSGHTPCLTALRTTISTVELTAHLRRLHTVGLEDGAQMLIRWYDTRVQRELYEALSPMQRSAVIAGIGKWSMRNRFGDWECLAEPALSPDLTQASGQLPLELSKEQYARLLDAAQPDVVLNHLRQLIPDEIAATDPRKLFAFVAEKTFQAMDMGYDGLYDQAQYLLPGLYTSGAACKHPAFAAAVTKGRDAVPLADRIAALDDAIWHLGRPLWETCPAGPNDSDSAT